MQYDWLCSGRRPTASLQAVEPRFAQMAFPSYLFDYNGVLVDDESVHLDAFRDVLFPYGVSVSDADYRSRYLGFDDVGAFQAILEDNAISFDEVVIEKLVDAKKPKYLERAERGLTFFPGARELLIRLAESGAVIGLVSGALRQEIDLGLRLLGVQNTVSFIVSSEDTRACKPDPEGYIMGRNRLIELVGNTAAHRVLVVEDSLAGIEAARGANMPCLAVSNSYEPAQLIEAGAVRVVSRLSKIDDALLASLVAEVYGRHA
jgi:HAD superfamily hydrolase (TIGR01509 family)